ncbi:hypothetical protein DFR41_10225 [Pseudacidovorax intermedius]|uniref:Uncharacterized protein n=1 Tax=Pseudacidovorax intermedius TaxID=433924 RepID=A0A370FP15_9BURK|nr:hypothetical protein [Pseudacidovorax intermedius]RDI26993.1 hypothetical protein DFR41_10225 [Pseudacidovorax intermedius]
MTFSTRAWRQSALRGGLAIALAASAWTAWAQPAPACDSRQDPAACRREAGAAREEARRGGLTTPAEGNAGANAMARCQLQPAADRADCEARVRGSGAGTTTTEGSVMGGGIIRETVTPIPAAPATPRP